MTLKELFRKIRRGRRWQINWQGTIRCDDGHCPLGAADDDLVDLPTYEGAAILLGLPVALARKIASAADNPKSRHRAWLIKQLGIDA